MSLGSGRHRVRAAARATVVAGAAAGMLLAACSAPVTSRVQPPADASPSPVTASPPGAGALPLRPGEWRVDLRLPQGTYRPSAPSGGTDDYRCFLLDPRLASDAFITGVDFVPGNPRVVHHAILYRVVPGQVAAAEARDQASGGHGWTCFGDPGLPAPAGDPVAALDSAPWLAGWAPGTGEQLFPHGTGVPLAAGSRIVLQVHYNLRQGGGTDDSRVQLRLAPGNAHLAPLHTQLLLAPVELPCAPGQSGPLCNRANSIADLVSRFGPEAGATVAGLQLLCGGTSLFAPRAGSTQSCTRTVRTPARVVAVAGHMHLLGKSIRIELDPGTPRARVLLWKPVWNFDDQRAVVLAHPVTIRPGDRLRITCTHDATLRNRLPELAGLPDRYVTWGAGTTDEMCLGILLETGV